MITQRKEGFVCGEPREDRLQTHDQEVSPSDSIKREPLAWTVNVTQTNLCDTGWIHPRVAVPARCMFQKSKEFF